MRRLILLAAGLVAGMDLFAQDRGAAGVDSGGGKRVSVLDQVVVTGASKAMRVREIPLAIQVVTGKQLDRSVDNNVIDAIAGRVAGFAAVKTGPNAVKLKPPGGLKKGRYKVTAVVAAKGKKSKAVKLSLTLR